MSVTKQPGKNLLAVYGNFLGHWHNAVRGYPAILRTDPSVRITCVTHKAVVKQFEETAASATLPGEDFSDRLEFVGICGDAIKDPANIMGHYEEIVEELLQHRWADMFDGKAGRPIPDALVTDYFLPQVIEHAKKVDHRATRFVHQPCLPGSLFQNMQRVRGQDEVMHSAGHPSLYPAEFAPASVPWPQELPDSIERAGNVPHWNADAHVLFTFSRELIPDTHKSWDELLAKGGKRSIEIMASYKPAFWSSPDVTTASDEVTAFLNEKLKTHGKQSVMWITFGTVHFPGTMRPDLFNAIIDTLIAAKRPFIFLATAATIMMMKDQGAELKEKIVASGNLVTGWCDQQALLFHPAMGSVLSHGGVNSCFEAIVASLPLVLYAVCADHPNNAVTLDITLDVGWELLQPKDQLVGKKLYNHPDVQVKGTPEAVSEEFKHDLKELDGPVGQRKRANAQRLSALLHAEAKKQPEYFKEWIAMWA